MRLPDEVVELAKIAPAEKKEPKGLRPRNGCSAGSSPSAGWNRPQHVRWCHRRRHHGQQRERHQLGLERALTSLEPGRVFNFKKGWPLIGPGRQDIAWPGL